MRLEINYKNKTVKNTNTWRLNNMLLINQWITEEIKEVIKKYLETNENENSEPTPVGCSKGSPQREFFFFFNFVQSGVLFIYLFIYLWLCWVFVSVRGLSLVAASGGHSS